MTIFEGVGMGRLFAGLWGGLILAWQVVPALSANDLPDVYSSHLDDAIEQSSKALKKP
jgi:hypothetical protein